VQDRVFFVIGLTVLVYIAFVFVYSYKICLFNVCFSDPRFILGMVLFVFGYMVNRWADYKLRALRDTKGDNGKYSFHP